MRAKFDLRVQLECVGCYALARLLEKEIGRRLYTRLFAFGCVNMSSHSLFGERGCLGLRENPHRQPREVPLTWFLRI